MISHNNCIHPLKANKYNPSKPVCFLFTCSLVLFFALSFELKAQQKNIPLSHDADWLYNFVDNSNSSQQPIHTGLQPVIENSGKHLLSEYAFRNSLDLSHQLDSSYNLPARSKLLRRKLKEESLININDTADRFHLTIDPLFNFQASQGNENPTAQNYFTNTRGFIVRADLGKNLSLESSFYENQATFPDYISAAAEYSKVVPGQGRWKRFKSNGYDYAMASGYISYAASSHFNLQLGHGKHFIGDGYHSLLLSDNAFNYPYLRLTSTFGKIQYTNIYAVFMNVNNGIAVSSAGSEALFQKKAASFQYLNWNVTKRIQLGLFQGLIWEAADNKNRQHLDANYFNPIIFSNALVYSLNNTNNVLIGGTLKLKIFKNNYFYAQYAIDGYDASAGSVFNKQAIQGGFKSFNIWGIKNLNCLVEYNQARPYTYAHVDPAQSYSHYDQPLAHPLGANFKELTGIISYRYHDFILKAKALYAKVGTDAIVKNTSSSFYPLTGSVGNSIFISDLSAINGINSTDNSQNQGNEITLKNIDLSLAYLVNPITNMQITGGVNYISGHSVSPLTFLYIGFKTSLSNIYYDF